MRARLQHTSRNGCQKYDRQNANPRASTKKLATATYVAWQTVNYFRPARENELGEQRMADGKANMSEYIHTYIHAHTDIHVKCARPKAQVVIPQARSKNNNEDHKRWLNKQLNFPCIWTDQINDKYIDTHIRPCTYMRTKASIHAALKKMLLKTLMLL